MRKRKDYRDNKRIRNELIAFAVFIFSMYLIFSNWQEYKAMKKSNEQMQATAIVYGKTAVQSLFEETYYYALLEDHLMYQATTKLHLGQKANITKEKFDELKDGASIDGYTVNGAFHTQEDLDGEYVSFYIGLAFGLLYPIGYLVYLISKIKIVRVIFERMAHAKRLNRFVNITANSLFFGGVIIGLFVFVFDLGDTLKNSYKQFTSEGYLETTAIVTEPDIDLNPSIYADSKLYLGLIYQTKNGQMVSLTKEVTEHTYDKYQNGAIPIKYDEQNPYQVYLQDPDSEDIYEILTSDFFLMLYLSVIIIALLIFALHLVRKRKRYGYY